MKRSLWRCVGVVALVFAAGLGALAAPCTITVQPGESIQAAIDAASPGDVICLSPGEWEQNLVIEKSLTLRGTGIESEPQPVIRSVQEGWPVILIRNGEPIDVSIQELMITGAFGDCYQWWAPEWICAYGISVHGKATAVFANNTISDNREGIAMEDSAQARIANNTISDNGVRGISMGASSQATIANNTISDNQFGISIRDSAQASIESNTISGNRWAGVSMVVSAQATIANNTISDNDEAIAMLGSSQATIESNTISGNGDGIAIRGSSQATIHNNTIRDNVCGIVTEHASQATIESNTISDNEEGIVMLGSSQATIESNVIRDSVLYGVALWERPCYDIGDVFTGYVTGMENTGGENAEGDTCPDDLAFLFTEEGGELDRRE